MEKIKLLLGLFPLLLAGCSNNNNKTEYDPFLVGDNLEAISSTEARLIANEAYDNLYLVSSLAKQSIVEEDNTKFFTGAFSSYAINKKTTTDSNAAYFSNKIESSRNVFTTTFIGQDTIEESSNATTNEWYGIKPVKEGETPSENYSLLKKTIDKYNGISSTRFSSKDEFSTKENVNAIWNRYLVNSISNDYLNSSILYSDDFTYVRDNQHVVGYYLSKEVSKETSKLAPGKDDVSYVKKIEQLSVIDYYRDEVLEIGWTIRKVSSRTTTSYLTTIEGKETDPIEVYYQEERTSLLYEKTHKQNENIPTYELTESIPFAISKFAPNEDRTDIEYVTKYEMENNDDYYRHLEDSFTGHAYYKEQKLSVGFYSFFDGNAIEPQDYEKWGYEAIIANKCVNYIVDPNTLLEEMKIIIQNHQNLFYVAAEATFSFRVVFNAEMTKASEFSVAIVGR